MRTAFYQYHLDHGAKMVDFAGWQMPIMYRSIHEEHRRVRESAGLFDVSHMGRLILKGPGARRLLERVLTRRVSDMDDYACRYSLVCNERGGVMDDVLVYRYEEHWLLVVNACNRVKILEHLLTHAGDDTRIEDQTTSTVMVALQGPKVIERIAQFSREVPLLRRYRFCIKQLLTIKMTISRTGYTGEDGVEVIMPASAAGAAIRLITGQRAIGPIGPKIKPPPGEDAEIKPVGLGARDTLRMEAAMPLYGHELSETIDPLTAGLGFAVDLDKHELDQGERFIGQEALEKIKSDGLQRLRVGLTLSGKRTARQGMKVTTADGAEIGEVTSGCVSPTLGCPIAMAIVDAEHAELGLVHRVAVGATTVDATVATLPFYKGGA